VLARSRSFLKLTGRCLVVPGQCLSSPGRHMGVTKFGYHLLSREYSRPPNLAISSWRGLPTLPAQRVADASHMLRSDVLRSVRANQPRALRARVVSACVHPPPLLSTTSPVGTTVSFGSPASST